MDRVARNVLTGWILVAMVLPLACAGGAWRSAVREDSPAAYYRFLRDHPDSKYSERAKARLEYHKIVRRPSLQAFVAFSERYPESELIEKLRPLLEEKAFEAARGQGTADAYDEFVAQFPSGDNAARAAGNAEYLREGGFGGRPDDLLAFAERHPESDFAAEAQRSAESLALREQTRFDRVGLRIQVSPGTPNPGGLAKSFAERAMATYREAGIELVALSPDSEPKGGVPSAQLTIHHTEGPVETRVSEGQIARSSHEARTVVTLRIGHEGPPIWEQVFHVRANPGEVLEQASLLFGPAGRRYWDDFFVPVSTWQSSSAVRAALSLTKKVSAVDAAGDRAVVLYGDGDFQLISLADPTAPVVLGEHRRDRDHKKWSGVRVVGEGIALFGEDGIELVQFTQDGSQTTAAIDRGSIGSVTAVEPVDGSLLVGTKRGLIRTAPDGSNPVWLLRREIRGLTAVGDALIFTDGNTVYVSTSDMLAQNRVLAQLKLGRGFAPGRVRAFGTQAIVVGRTGTLILDVREPRKPVVTSQLYAQTVGQVRDAARVGRSIFLLGQRGLLVLDAGGRKVVDTIDLETRDQVAVMGRHVVAVGGESLQVMDATPFNHEAPAAPAE